MKRFISFKVPIIPNTSELQKGFISRQNAIKPMAYDWTKVPESQQKDVIPQGTKLITSCFPFPHSYKKYSKLKLMPEEEQTQSICKGNRKIEAGGQAAKLAVLLASGRMA